MPRHTKKTRSKKQKTSKRRRISTMRFKSSNRPPRRSDIRGGSYGASSFPASFPAGNPPVYNADPSRFGISASNLPDIKGGSRRMRMRRGKFQKGGNFHQAYLNGINGLSNLSNAGVAGNGIMHPPLITDITGVSAFGSGLINGPQQTTLSITNPPLA